MEETTPTQTPPKGNTFAAPLAIVIAGVLIAAAVIVNGREGAQGGSVPAVRGNLEAMAPVTSADHIRGNPNAPVVIVEYTDFECPFCKSFHATMQNVMKEYGTTGEVAWVLRQFPIPQLHAKAEMEAFAAECAASLGGETAFWQFADRFFALTPSNDRTDLEVVLPHIADEIGIDENAFAECIERGRFAEKVGADAQNALATGANGTPWSIVVGKDGKKYPLSGAQPYTVVKQLIELALKD